MKSLLEASLMSSLGVLGSKSNTEKENSYFSAHNKEQDGC